MLFKKLLVLSMFSLLSFPMIAQAQVPAWFNRDVARKASWLPANLKAYGINGAYQRSWASLPADVQQNLIAANIPQWMIALIPSNASTNDTFQQLRGMNSLNGAQANSVVANRAETLLMFAGSARLPTPGDTNTGLSLGAEGCSAAMSKYILAELKIEFPDLLADMPDELANSQSSDAMNQMFYNAWASGASWLSYTSVPFSQLTVGNVSPGAMMIGQKPGGTHMFGWTRVESSWNWSPDDMMAIGNTGLPQFGDRMILAQEYLTDNPGEASHNTHGPLNSSDVVYDANGNPVLSSSGTNVYYVQNANFIVISFR